MTSLPQKSIIPYAPSGRIETSPPPGSRYRANVPYGSNLRWGMITILDAARSFGASKIAL